MNHAIKDCLVSAIQRLRKPLLLAYYAEFDLTTWSLMKAIEDNHPDSPNNMYMFDLQNDLRISRGAISQIARTLETKGYLLRAVDQRNRRKQIVTLTPAGHAALRQADAVFDTVLTAFLTRLGDQDAAEVIRLFNRFADIAEEFRHEHGDG